MWRLQQKMKTVYLVKVQWECEFDDAGRPAHAIIQQSPLCTRDSLYRGRTKAMRLHHKARENETIQYLEVMSLYPYICKYFEFPVGHPIIHVGDACKDIEACLRMEGLNKCSIVPPERFYHPDLPFIFNNKQMFCLRRTCVLTSSSSKECVHTRD